MYNDNEHNNHYKINVNEMGFAIIQKNKKQNKMTAIRNSVSKAKQKTYLE